MSGFVLGFLACYLVGCALEYRLLCAWSRSKPMETTLLERLALAMIWPLTQYGMADDI